jgi:hypothetical protein
VVIDLATGSIAQVARGDGNPINIINCQFAAADRIVCTLWGLSHFQSYLVPMRRTLSMDTDGKNQIFLGQKDTLEQVGKRFGDGEVLDWLNGVDGMVLMARSYVPESTTGRLVGRKEEGLGVDRIDARTGKVTQVERPGDDVSGYISDGLGNIRIMSTTQVTESAVGPASIPRRWIRPSTRPTSSKVSMAVTPCTASSWTDRWHASWSCPTSRSTSMAW